MKSVQIIPIKFIITKKEAVELRLSIFDNLKDSCTINWQLKDVEGNAVYDGSNTLTGEDYQKWDGSNDYPADYVCLHNFLTKKII